MVVHVLYDEYMLSIVLIIIICNILCAYVYICINMVSVLVGRRKHHQR